MGLLSYMFSEPQRRTELVDLLDPVHLLLMFDAFHSRPRRVDRGASRPALGPCSLSLPPGPGPAGGRGCPVEEHSRGKRTHSERHLCGYFVSFDDATFFFCFVLWRELPNPPMAQSDVSSQTSLYVVKVLVPNPVLHSCCAIRLAVGSPP